MLNQLEHVLLPLMRILSNALIKELNYLFLWHDDIIEQSYCMHKRRVGLPFGWKDIFLVGYIK